MRPTTSVLSERQSVLLLLLLLLLLSEHQSLLLLVVVVVVCVCVCSCVCVCYFCTCLRAYVRASERACVYHIEILDCPVRLSADSTENH